MTAHAALIDPGSTVAVVSPAGAVDTDLLLAGMQVLRSFGLQVEDHTTRGPVHDYLAAPDNVRAHALMTAWMMPGYSAVFCAAGGYGSARTLRLLDWERMAQVRPPLLVGSSDITALHLAVARRLGCPSLLGPLVCDLAEDRVSEWSRQRLRRQLLGSDEAVDAPSPLAGDVPASDGSGPAETGPVSGLRSLAPGQGRGLLAGGNLTVLASLMGTPEGAPPDHDIVLALEDVHEAAYRVDRAVNQLDASGWLSRVQAVLLGDFVDCSPDPTPMLAGFFAERHVPVVSGMAFGHAWNQDSLPLGTAVTVAARLDEMPVIRW